MKLTPKEMEQVAKLLADAVYGNLDVSRLEVDAETLEAALVKVNNARPTGLAMRLSRAIARAEAHAKEKLIRAATDDDMEVA